MICNHRKNNFLVAIPHAKSRSAEDGFLLAVTVPHSIEFGALKVNIAFYFFKII